MELPVLINMVQGKITMLHTLKYIYFSIYNINKENNYTNKDSKGFSLHCLALHKTAKI